jgi:hypothetical protein
VRPMPAFLAAGSVTTLKHAAHRHEKHMCEGGRVLDPSRRKVGCGRAFAWQLQCCLRWARCVAGVYWAGLVGVGEWGVGL